LRVAEKFEQSHLSSPVATPLIDSAKILYVEGYFLTRGTCSVMELGKKGKVGRAAQLVSEYGTFPQIFVPNPLLSPFPNSPVLSLKNLPL